MYECRWIKTSNIIESLLFVTKFIGVVLRNVAVPPKIELKKQ